MADPLWHLKNCFQHPGHPHNCSQNQMTILVDGSEIPWPQPLFGIKPNKKIMGPTYQNTNRVSWISGFLVAINVVWLTNQPNLQVVLTVFAVLNASLAWRGWPGVGRTTTRWWQLKDFFIFIPIWGRWTHFDSYFSNGLKPPTRPHLRFAKLFFGYWKCWLMLVCKRTLNT